MRRLHTHQVLQTAAAELEAARRAAIAAIGERGATARQIMERARREALCEIAEERWERITRASHRTRFKPPADGEATQELPHAQ